MSFVTNSTESFLKDFFRITDKFESGTVANWLIENADKMTDKIFFDKDFDWSGINPDYILALRACAPAGVFSSLGKKGFIDRVHSDYDLLKMSDALFDTDFNFLEKLPLFLSDYKDILIQLMQLAYRKNIRPADPLVKEL